MNSSVNIPDLFPLFDLNAPFSVVDVETTGNSHSIGHIIEIAIVRVENRAIVDQFQSFIRPPIPVPSFITKLTGISDTDLAEAPVFADIQATIAGKLQKSFFVAHNVSFDYSYIKTEFERIGRRFFMDRFCTVKLGRKLYPGHRLYNLDALAERFEITANGRHRALSDALITAEIFEHYLRHPDAAEVFSKYQRSFEKKEKWLEEFEDDIFKLPATKGVYFFKDRFDLPLYIGKSTNIRSRVLSHLREDKLSKKKRLFRSTHRFDFVECRTELEALILESRLIKKHQPPFNIQQLDKKNYVYLRITDDAYPKILIAKHRNADATYVGPFRSVRLLEHVLERVRRHFKLCPELLRERRLNKGFCFAYQLNQCCGACGEAITPEDYQQIVHAATTMVENYLQLNTKESIDNFLKSAIARQSDLKEVKNALKRTKKMMLAIPEMYSEKLILVDELEKAAYLINEGLLSGILTAQDTDRVNWEEWATTIPPDRTDEDWILLDERETIQRFIRTNRDRIRLIPVNKLVPTS
ncbi:GIY-YIG nuclease family protein [bacterium]|nr:GIY-YIG nuclease family protein [bacterium]